MSQSAPGSRPPPQSFDASYATVPKYWTYTHKWQCFINIANELNVFLKASKYAIRQICWPY
jgi:hypothetical protein